MDTSWVALRREATSAGEHLAFGTTVIGRANYAHDAHYTQAFFALSVGFERTAKLAVLVDHAIDNHGAFPSEAEVRKYGHDLDKLLRRVDAIARDRGFTTRLPESEIHRAIVTMLSDFARNITRYYNLDVVTGASRSTTEDPIARWYASVTTPIIARHLSERTRNRIERNARAVAELTDGLTIVHHHAETGEEIREVNAASMRTGYTEAARPWERMYLLQLARFATQILVELGYVAQGAGMDVPYFSEIFAIFNNDDSMLRTRKTWSIYH
jgi:hypothetical protein